MIELRAKVSQSILSPSLSLSSSILIYDQVLSLFDSQSLETQQLTEYVDILRMMGCPRDLIIEKFLAAHKYRFYFPPSSCSSAQQRLTDRSK
jgi:hypothetical protein